MPVVMRGLTLTVPSLINLIDLLHVFMPVVMRGLTLTVPSLVHHIELLHNYMPVVMRGLPLTVPSLVNYIDLCIYAPRGTPGVQHCVAPSCVHPTYNRRA